MESGNGEGTALERPVKVASPEATGGAGGNFEARVGAIVLARLVRGDRVEGLGLPIKRVGLQQRYAGHMLDDVVVEGIDALGGSRVIEYQAKRRVSPAPNDPDFVETIKRCLDSIRNDGDDGEIARRRRRFGLVSNPSGPLHDLARVTVVARSHDRASSFLDVIRSTARAGVRQRLNQLRQTVTNLLSDPDDTLAPEAPDSDVDTFTWQIAKALYIWELDAEPSGASVLAVQDRLDDLTTGTTDAVDVFDTLIQLARDWAPHAAGIDLAMVRLALEDRGFALDQAPAQAVAFQALVAASQDTLDTSVVRLGHQLQLPRLEFRDKIVDAVAQNDATLLSGRAGVGKSMLGRLVAEDLRADGAIVIGISLTGRSGSLSVLEADLGVRLSGGFAGAPIGALRVLVIDGAEQALSDAGALLKSILGALPSTSAGAPPWRVVLTARDEAARTVLALVHKRINNPVRFPVGELSDAEIAQVLETFPVLQPLQRNHRAEALLLRRPYLIELLIRSTAVEGLTTELIGEEDLMEVVTTRLVRRDNGGLLGLGEPDARSDIYLALAVDAMADALPSLLDGRDAEARRGLYSDDVIAPTRPTQLSWRFAHDILVDYAVAARLLEPGGSGLLAAAPQPRRLLRAVRLFMQRELADACIDGSVVEAWNTIVSDAEQLAARDGDRWRDVPYEALLHLGAARDALAQLTDALVADDGAALFRLVDVAERLARLNVSNDGQGPVALDTALTGPAVDLLGSLGAQVPAACLFRAARLVHHHLVAAFTYRGESEAGLENAVNLPAALITWAGDASYGAMLELCLGSLGFLGARLDADGEAFLIRHAQDGPHHVAEVVESPAGAGALAVSRPDLMLRLGGLYYLGWGLSLNGTTGKKGKRPRSRFSRGYASPFRQFDDDDELGEDGVRDHDPKQSRHLAMFPLGNNQANPALGPFLALLTAHNAEGLRLIGAVVDAATVARQRLEAGFESNEPSITLQLRIGEPPTTHDFSGPATVWCWHRRTTVGPRPAQSALMALRQWASAQIINGVPVVVVRDQILNTGVSLAFAAVAWFVMLEHLDTVGDEMDPFLIHPEVWSLEIMRRVHEPGGTALDVPEVTRLDWMVSQVAMQLVLRGNGDRRDRLAELGTQLVENARTSGHDDIAVVQRQASELDIANYRAEPHEEGTVVSVDYDADVLAALAECGAATQRGLNGVGLMRRAASMRDGEGELDHVEALWHEIDEYVRQPTGMGIHKPRDLVAASAAGVVRAARDNTTVDDSAFHDAVAMLLRYAAEIAHAAPPDLDTFTQVDDTDEDIDAASGKRFVRDMSWEDSFDRSVATALPWLMADEALMARASVTPQQVGDALTQIASGPYNQARGRLADGLIPMWELGCNDRPIVHEAVVTAVSRLIEAAGYGPMSRFGYEYAHATLPSPVGDFLDSSNDLVLELNAAAFAIPVLAAGATLECTHGAEAKQLLDALIAYDERVWPDQYARHHYIGTSLWRHQVDRVLAQRILAGDVECLERRLDVFAGVGEQLVSLLTLLTEEAKDADTAAQLHTVWSHILDRLLPSGRDLRASDSGREHPYHRDVEELDRALLLVPGHGVDYWPWRETVALAGRWLEAFTGRADVADRAITFSGRLFGIQTDIAAQFSLRALGDNAESIKRESHMAVAFLQLILRDPPSETVELKARAVLDGLAAIGDEFALDVQRELENN